jgi:hypothetical protein
MEKIYWQDLPESAEVTEREHSFYYGNKLVFWHGHEEAKAQNALLARRTEPDEPENNGKPSWRRQSRVINRDYVRKWALDYAQTNRFHKFTRVSEQFLNAIEVQAKIAIRDRVNRHPGRGKTLT